MELANLLPKGGWAEQYLAPVAHVILPLLALVIGWVVAHLASWLVRRVLLRTRLDDKLLELVMGRDAAPEIHAERWISRAVFYLVMLFVIVGFFQMLELAALTQPINGMLNQIFVYLPKLLSAALLLFAAWVAGSMLRRLVTGVLTRVNIDRRLAEPAGLEPSPATMLPSTVGNVAYWLTFLILLPAVLDALGLQGLLQPVQATLAKAIGYLPNLFGAVLILLVGWLGARIVQQIVSNVLDSTGVNDFGRRIGLAAGLGIESLSGLAGALSYGVILLLAVVAALESLHFTAITNPASAMLEGAFRALPAILTAGAILLIGYLVAQLASRLVDDVLRQLGFNTFLQRLGIAGAADPDQESPSIAEGASTVDDTARPDPALVLERPPSQLAGYVAMAAILLLSAMEAAGQLGFHGLSELLVSLTRLLGRVILGAVILAIGLYVAALVGGTIARRGGPHAGPAGTVARVAIIGLSLFVGLTEMGFAEEIVTLAFGLSVGAAAVAAAIAFGMGGRDLARRRLEQWTQSLSEPTEGEAAPPEEQ